MIQDVYSNPSIFDEDHIHSVSKLVKDIVFTTSLYEDALKDVKPGDFTYLDPPYAPEKTDSFVSYTRDGFCMEDHMKLFQLCHDLNNNSVRFILSNADVKLVRDAFTSPPYTTKTIVCKRRINSKRPESTTNEVLVWNFEYSSISI